MRLILKMNILKFLLLLTIVMAATGQSHKMGDFWYTKTATVTVSECGSDPLYYIDLLNLDAYACLNFNGSYDVLRVKTSYMASIQTDVYPIAPYLSEKAMMANKNEDKYAVISFRSSNNQWYAYLF